MWSTEKEFLSYLAGIVDGEGTITFWKSKNYNRRAKNHNVIHYVPVLFITNNDLELLKALKTRIGGSIRGRLERGNERRTYLLHLSYRQVRQILPKLAECLFIKREQAYLMLRWFELTPSGSNRLMKSNGKRNSFQPNPNNYERMLLVKKIRELNHTRFPIEGVG